MTTLSRLIDKTIRKLAMVSGTGVQLYAEDRVADALQETFNMLFDEEWWYPYRARYMRSLDGITGMMTQTMPLLKRIEDIKYIYTQNRRAPLSILPDDLIGELLTGTTARFFDASNTTPNKPIVIYPLTATDTLYITARNKPDDFGPDDDVKLDEVALVNGAAWEYLESDGSNPGAAQKCQVAFEARLKQLKKLHRSVPILGNPMDGGIPTEWYDSPRGW